MTVRLSTALVAGLLAVALVAAALLLWPQWRDLQEARDRDADRDAVLEVARAEVSGLTTMSPATLDDRLEELTARLTGDFSQQFQAMYSTFASVVKRQEVTSVGSIQSAGVTRLEGRRAEVIVAARAKVSDPDGEVVRRSYRFAVSLRDTGGEWLVSGMRFVE